MPSRLGLKRRNCTALPTVTAALLPFWALDPRAADSNPTSAHTAYMTVGKSLNLSSQFSPLWNGAPLLGANELMNGELLGTWLGLNSSCWESQLLTKIQWADPLTAHRAGCHCHRRWRRRVQHLGQGLANSGPWPVGQIPPICFCK